MEEGGGGRSGSDRRVRRHGGGWRIAATTRSISMTSDSKHARASLRSTEPSQVPAYRRRWRHRTPYRDHARCRPRAPTAASSSTPSPSPLVYNTLTHTGGPLRRPLKPPSLPRGGSGCLVSWPPWNSLSVAESCFDWILLHLNAPCCRLVNHRSGRSVS